MTVGGSPLECGLESADSPSHESVRAHDLVMRTTRSMQPSYNHHAIGMQAAVATAVQVPTKEVPTKYLWNTLVEEYPTQCLWIVLLKSVLNKNRSRSPDGL